MNKAKKNKTFFPDYWTKHEPETKPSSVFYNKKKKNKVVLTATVTEESYRRLKRLIPEGEVSKFIDKIIRKSLQEVEQKISMEYKKMNQDKNIISQLKKLNICHEKSKK